METRHTILLIDDDPDLLDVYREVLGQLPSQPVIRTASFGARGLAMLETEPVSLLICDLKMLKLRSTVMGKAPAGVNYRFNLTFKSEELRQKWIASDVHQKVWPTIENTLTTKDYTVLLFDAI